MIETTVGTSFIDRDLTGADQNLFYKVVAFDFNGNQGVFSSEAGIEIITGVADQSNLPEEFALAQNYPNPFNPTTTISFDVAEQSQVSIAIFNIMGQKVRTLLNTEKAPGTYQIQWNGQNDYGVRVASGMYVYVLKAY